VALVLLALGTTGALAAVHPSASERSGPDVLGAPRAQPGASRPLRTAILDDATFLSGDSELAFRRARSTGATLVRLGVRWREVALRRPREATSPADAAYDWKAIDRVVALAVRNGLAPILSIFSAPQWATGSASDNASFKPDPVELGRFARAAATRYGGSFRGLPRIRYWQVWNEPNLSIFLAPQYENGRPFAPAWYRRMVNAFAAGVRSVHSDNLVVAGGTAPFRDITPAVTKVDPRWGPLSFMRELLCLDRSLRRKCRARVRVDVWAHHPYTSGGPTHSADLSDDVSLGDLREMKAVLDAGVRAGNVVSSEPVQFWVTEFSWDSNPPDPEGVPAELHARWIAEALYRMWRAGVSLVTWFSLRDDPLTASYYQSSLFLRGATLEADRPKLGLQAFRFPLVAFPAGPREVYVWGRTPAGRRGRVVVEQSLGGGWRQLGLLTTDRYGIFTGTFAASPDGSVRARLRGRPDEARPFSLSPVADRIVNPFGQEALTEPRKPGG
jgi:hypothetical protein